MPYKYCLVESCVHLIGCSGGDEIICPRCRRVISLGDRGVAGLPRNVDLGYAVEVLKPILVATPNIPGGHDLGKQCKLRGIYGEGW